MDDPTIVEIVSGYGGLGLLAVFAWLLLKSVLKDKEKLADMLANHLKTLLERAERTNEILKDICQTQKEIIEGVKEMREHK